MRALTIIALAVLFQPTLQNQAGIVSGIVTRTDGITPLSEVRIELVETFPSQRLRKPFAAETTTDGAGRFMVGNVPEGEFEVRATLDGFLDRGESVTGARGIALVNLTTGRRVEVRLALAAGSTVRGRLVDD